MRTGERRGAGRRALRLLLVAVAVSAWPVTPVVAAGPVQASDALAAAPPVGPVDGMGQETTLTSAAVFTSAPVSYSSAGYSWEDGEAAFSDVDYASCAERVGEGFVRHTAARTAWLRFRPGIAGSLTVIVNSSYDAMINVRALPYSAGSYTLATAGGVQNCQDSRSAMPNETLTNEPVTDPAALVLVQVGVSCPRPVTAQSCAAADGGPTSITLRFTPANRDADAVPDTLDACPDDAGTARNGCTDADGDGASDAEDACLGIVGDLADGCLSTDVDRDGAQTPADCDDHDPAVRPGTVEVVGNAKDDDCDGIQAIDADRDGSLRPADCDDADAAIRPGAREIPYSGRDEDCSGGDGTLPGIAPEISIGRITRYAASGRAGIEIKVVGAVAGLTVEVRCQGRGCPASIVRRTVRRPGSVRVGAFARRTLRTNATVEVRLSLPGHVTRSVTYRVRPRKTIVTVGCIVPGTSKVRPTC